MDARPAAPMHAGLLLSILLSQVPCAPMESTVVCGCKQGNASACAALEDANPELAKQILRLVAMAKAAQEARKAQEDRSAASVDTGCPQSPNDDDKQCVGQEHHIISQRIAAALAKHRTLAGLYQPRDRRFVARASDLKAHCGYQGWHRSIDVEVTKWLNGNKDATAKQFEELLREIYARPEMRARFPSGF